MMILSFVKNPQKPSTNFSRSQDLTFPEYETKKSPCFCAHFFMKTTGLQLLLVVRVLGKLLWSPKANIVVWKKMRILLWFYRKVKTNWKYYLPETIFFSPRVSKFGSCTFANKVNKISLGKCYQEENFYTRQTKWQLGKILSLRYKNKKNEVISTLFWCKNQRVKMRYFCLGVWLHFVGMLALVVAYASQRLVRVHDQFDVLKSKNTKFIRLLWGQTCLSLG